VAGYSVEVKERVELYLYPLWAFVAGYRVEVKERVELYLYSPSGPSLQVIGWRLKKEYSYTSTPPLGLRGRL